MTHTGSVPACAQKLAAVRAASRVYGVKAVAGELTVKLAGEPRDDSGSHGPSLTSWPTPLRSP